MAADDHPIEALRRHLDLEDSFTSPVTSVVLKLISLSPLQWPFGPAVGELKNHLAAAASERIRIMLDTCMEEIVKQDAALTRLKESLGADERQHRIETARDLLLDAAQKAADTRAIDRVKRIGLVLANGIADPSPTDADEIDEMMRIAMALDDRDISHLGELVRVEGGILERVGRIERYTAYTTWERCSWGTRIDSELDSVFSKLVSYGLVAQIPPPNNLNISADFQNRYVLLKKGLRFVELIRKKAIS